MEPVIPAAQQAAILELRARYEHGDISYEAFRQALDAVVHARDAAECQAILQTLPASPLAALAALDRPHPLPALADSRRQPQRIVAFLSQTQKVRRRWRPADDLRVMACMGEVKLDLRLAELSPQTHLRISAIMGSVTIYVPRHVRVSVRTRLLLGDANALGESVSGVFAASHEEHIPEEGLAPAAIEIDCFLLMGNVKVVLADSRAISIGELVREALTAVADGLRRGWQQGAPPRGLLPEQHEPGSSVLGLARPADSPHA